MTRASAAGQEDDAVTDTIVRHVRRINYAALPDSIRELARQCLLDWLGVTIAGAATEAAALVRREISREGGDPVATVIGTSVRATASQAALANGTASHVLDYDDVSVTMIGHPSVPVLPALVALAEELDATGAELLSAFVCGYETECLVARLIQPEHYAKGFHSTSTLGTFGSAAACAHLLGLDAQQWPMALGIAGTQAAGLKSMFGSMTKSLHAGLAARNGYLAARLASLGYTADGRVLDSAQGFADTHGSSPHVDAFRAAMSDFELFGVGFKAHAACAFTHSSIEGLLEVRERTRLAPADVARVVIRISPASLTAAGIERPTTALEAKFSIPMTSAMALATGDLSEGAFTDDVVSDPLLVALCDRVEVIAEPERSTASSRVEVTTLQGNTHTAEVDVLDTNTSTDPEWQWDRLTTKFTGLVSPIIGAAKTDQLITVIRSCGPGTLVREILAATQGGHAVTA